MGLSISDFINTPKDPSKPWVSHHVLIDIEWTIRNVYSVQDRLKNIPYPDPTTQIQADPISIIYILPESVFITQNSNEDIKVGVWDEKEQVWSTDLIDDYQLDTSSRKLEFTTRKLAQMAFL